jgi:hypothetical protein
MSFHRPHIADRCRKLVQGPIGLDTVYANSEYGAYAFKIPVVTIRWMGPVRDTIYR